MRLRRAARAAAVTVVAASSMTLASLASLGPGASTAAAGAATTTTTTPAPVESSCQLGNGNKRVVEIFFDNVHFFRDNPDVESDMEQIPALMNFIEDNGTMLSNSHTPLIAHTSDDSITNYTGLYGTRQGMGIGNDYEVYNSSGGVDPAASWAYWTDPIDYTAAQGTDTGLNQPYSATDPATSTTTNGQETQDPAPWVPYTRAGCDVGDVASGNQVLENVNPDVADVFGQDSPEEQQVEADPNTQYDDQEVADYVGLTVHCAKGSTFCSTAKAVKYGQTTASATATPDLLPTEPGGYTGYEDLNGHKYLQPQLASIIGSEPGATTTSSGLYDPNGYQVTDSAGNLVDLFGNEMDGDYVSGPGFPGFAGITAAQSLAYTADMLEAGVPITYAYISDLHERKYYPSGYKSGSGTGAPPSSCGTAGAKTGWAIGPGDPCYTYNASQWNAAFAEFFQRLAADGITPANTTFVFAADEGDHFSGANVGRGETPSCSGTAGTTSYSCSYPEGTLGEVDTDIHGLLQAETGDTTPFYSEPQGEAIYVTGDQSQSTVRQLERDLGSLTVDDPFAGSSGNPDTPITDYMADETEEGILHITDADPDRTPTLTLFPQPDLYFSSGTSDSCSTGTTKANAASNCASIDQEYAWNHGYYAPEIDTTWLGLVGPGVKNLGLDGDGPAQGPNSAGPNSGDASLVSDEGTTGTWVDQADVRPTLMALVGLQDDYVEDGRVITEVMKNPPADTQSPDFQPLAVCYKQLYSSVGEFGSDTLAADTAELQTGSASDDSSYQSFEQQLGSLASQRDSLADEIKQELYDAEFDSTPLPADASSQTSQCEALLTDAANLGSSPGSQVPETTATILLPTAGFLVIAAGLFVLRRRGRRRLAARVA